MVLGLFYLTQVFRRIIYHFQHINYVQTILETLEVRACQVAYCAINQPVEVPKMYEVFFKMTLLKNDRIYP